METRQREPTGDDRGGAILKRAAAVKRNGRCGQQRGGQGGLVS